MPRVSNKTLFLIAGLVWLAAGINILVIGIRAYIDCCGNPAEVETLPPLPMLSVAVFAFFWFMVFSRILRKHTARINSYGSELQPVWLFFDKGSYIVMAFMMTLGISLRAFNLVPGWFIAFFYTGLGLALAMAGVGFLFGWRKAATPQTCIDSAQAA